MGIRFFLTKSDKRLSDERLSKQVRVLMAKLKELAPILISDPQDQLGRLAKTLAEQQALKIEKMLASYRTSYTPPAYLPPPSRSVSPPR